MVVYLESSAALRYLLDSPDVYAEFGAWSVAISSELLEIECHRAFDRLRLENKIDDEKLVSLKQDFADLLKIMDIVPISRDVVNLAKKSFPVIIRSLDALHMATALLYQQKEQINLKIVTHDKNLERLALALNMPVLN